MKDLQDFLTILWSRVPDPIDKQYPRDSNWPYDMGLGEFLDTFGNLIFNELSNSRRDPYVTKQDGTMVPLLAPVDIKLFYDRKFQNTRHYRIQGKGQFTFSSISKSDEETKRTNKRVKTGTLSSSNSSTRGQIQLHGDEDDDSASTSDRENSTSDTNRAKNSIQPNKRDNDNDKSSTDPNKQNNDSDAENESDF
mmetsp:Transcript_20888/g.34983  ORF Transcript_20888/g.34983 Transcript_20888/m.34983 type:complete len:194 (+) Transcript_20888:846-1427(+)|eukprot:CAMPEP_0174993622 /NCGR_PEP_ID=MMETSP0004_2-20121128/23177_1 /TAXON_ID=420556 /ORGANISM="Ochromonas sp., Strain CCMP1393" /LENGTH=193 /DNA_ID=CAMNT_0016247757 /DNA_START=1037 /DNA_END=1618 /DNA_ORIENTATION=+